MSLSATGTETGKRYFAFDFQSSADLHQEIDEPLECHYCTRKMSPVNQAINGRSAHFRHTSAGAKERECRRIAYGSHPESPEHVAAKTLLFTVVRGYLGQARGMFPLGDLEMPVDEVRRIADAAFVFPIGWRVVLEAQLAPITVQELVARTRDYWAANCDVFWFFGRDADKGPNRGWSLRTFGRAGRLCVANGVVEDVTLEYEPRIYRGKAYPRSPAEGQLAVGRAVGEWVKDAAFFRFFELKGRGCVSDVVEGAASESSRLRSSFSNSLGTYLVRDQPSKNDVFLQRAGREFFVSDQPALARAANRKVGRALGDDGASM